MAWHLWWSASALTPARLPPDKFGQSGNLFRHTASNRQLNFAAAVVVMAMEAKNASGRGELELIERAVLHDEAAIRTILQANNRRLYRLARSIVRDDGEAEDVLQEAYCKAFAALKEFRGGSTLTTWLSSIVRNEALQWLRRRTDIPTAPRAMPVVGAGQVIPFPTPASQTSDPERVVAQRQIWRLLERAIDNLPDEFRTVVVARIIEDMTVEETSQLLGVLPETVKTRLHRARRLLKIALAEHLDPMFKDIFPFDGERCARLTSAVIERLKVS